MKKLMFIACFAAMTVFTGVDAVLAPTKQPVTHAAFIQNVRKVFTAYGNEQFRPDNLIRIQKLIDSRPEVREIVEKEYPQIFRQLDQPSLVNRLGNRLKTLCQKGATRIKLIAQKSFAWVKEHPKATAAIAISILVAGYVARYFLTAPAPALFSFPSDPEADALFKEAKKCVFPPAHCYGPDGYLHWPLPKECPAEKLRLMIKNYRRCFDQLDKYSTIRNWSVFVRRACAGKQSSCRLCEWVKTNVMMSGEPDWSGLAGRISAARDRVWHFWKSVEWNSMALGETEIMHLARNID
jgi:hypothetical protein